MNDTGGTVTELSYPVTKTFLMLFDEVIKYRAHGHCIPPPQSHDKNAYP